MFQSVNGSDGHQSAECFIPAKRRPYESAIVFLVIQQCQNVKKMSPSKSDTFMIYQIMTSLKWYMSSECKKLQTNEPRWKEI